MKKVKREEIVDYVTYADQRDKFRSGVLEQKEARRVHVPPFLMFLFENTDTVRYQVQEMMRVEKIVRESEIQHELDTYNELLGKKGELGCTLLIEIDDPEVRQLKLTELLDLPRHLWMEVEGGERVPASYDERQIGDDRLSSVQFLKFDTQGRKPVAMGSDHPALKVRTELDARQRQALEADLDS